MTKRKARARAEKKEAPTSRRRALRAALAMLQDMKKEDVEADDELMDVVSDIQETCGRFGSTKTETELRAALIEELGDKTRFVGCHKIKRVQLKRTLLVSDNLRRGELKVNFGLIHSEIVKSVAAYFAKKQPTAEEIRNLVWQLTYHLLYKSIPSEALFEPLESLIPDEHLKFAKEPSSTMLEVLSMLKEIIPQDLLELRSPMLFLRIFLSSVRLHGEEYIKSRRAFTLFKPIDVLQTWVNTEALAIERSYDIKLNLNVQKETIRVQKNWFAALADVEKVTLYLMDAGLYCTCHSICVVLGFI